jgi:hydrogenase expression/formation protein HypC
MQVVSVEPGHAVCSGRGEQRRVRIALIGEVRQDDWLLVFLDSAIERLSVDRAAEISATLDLLAAVQAGADGNAPAQFDLPSRMSREQLMQLSGHQDCHPLSTSPSLAGTAP